MNYTRHQVMSVLSDVFGHTEFRLGQTDVIRSVLGGGPTVAVLPTGAGKSLCYQLPGLLFGGTTLVISPLIALMRDQVQALRKLGVAAASFDSAQSFEERNQAENDFVSGKLNFLYVSPERLSSQRFLNMLAQAATTISLVAIDEAHCVARWGHDFRPDYMNIDSFLEYLQPQHVAAFTATATPELREELGEALGFENPEVFVRGFLRDNINIETRKMTSDDFRNAEAVRLVKQREGDAPALIYAGTRRACEELVDDLARQGLSAAFYHGGCNGESRAIVQDKFLNNELDALVATNAFGMGIDKPDIRLLIHLHLPRSFEDYYQEFGRAGRDGKASLAVMLWRGKDYRTHDFLIKQSDSGESPDPRHVAAAMRRLSRVYDWAQSSVCSWRRVLDYFGDPEVSALDDGCGNCCRCARNLTNPPQLVTGDKYAAAFTTLKSVSLWHTKFGRKKTAGILRGSKAVGIPVTAIGYCALPKHTLAALDEIIQALLDAGYLAVVGSEYPVIDITPKAKAVLDNGGDILLNIDSVVPIIAEVVDANLEAIIKEWRQSKAQELGVPAYRIFSNKVLEQIVSRVPENESDLLKVPGIGPAKVDEFGYELLEALKGAIL
ncbi:MAG: ATP-dependent DNA helicase RecQ [Myxococcota bacterium]|jgi:ATP-dependent DNA helicase RecQ